MQKLIHLADRVIYYSFLLLLFLVPLVYFHGSSEFFELNKLSLTYIFTAIILSAWITKSAALGKIVIIKTNLAIPIFLFLLSQLISSLLSIDPRSSFIGYYSRWNGGFFSTLAYVLLFFAYISNVTKTETKNIIFFLLLSASIVSLIAVLEHFGIYPTCVLINHSFTANCWDQNTQERVFSTIGQPNWLAAWNVSLIPVVWTGTLYNPFLIILISAATLFTKSRSGAFALLIAFVVFWKIYSGRLALAKISKHFLLSFIISAAVVIGIFAARIPVYVEGRSGNNITDSTSTVETRKILWQEALQIWKKYPIFGSGVETFAFTFYNLKPQPLNMTFEWDYLYNKAHNEYLNLAANSGGVGIITYLLMIVLTIRQFLHALSKNNNPEWHTIAALFSGYISILVSNFFGFSVVPISLLFYIYPAMVITFLPPKSGYKFRMIRFPAGIILLFPLISALFLISKYWYADFVYSRGNSERSENNLALSIKLLEKSVNLLPGEANYRSSLAHSLSLKAVELFEKQDPGYKEIAELSKDFSLSAISLSPRSVPIRRSASSRLTLLAGLENKYFPIALETYESTIPLAPSDAKLHYNYALALYFSGDKKSAISMMEKAVSLKGNYKEARLALSVMYKNTGNPEKAKKELEYIINNIDSSDTEALEELEKLVKN